MSKRIKIKIPAPKIRKPVAKKPNSVMKSKKTYTRKEKHGNLRIAVSEE